MSSESQDFAAAFRVFLEDMRAQAPAVVSPLREHLQDLFGVDPSTLALVSEEHPSYDLPNVQLAIEQIVASDGIEARTIGIVPDRNMCGDLGNNIVSPPNRPGESVPQEGPMTYSNVHLHDQQVLPCARLAMHLIKTPESAHAMFVSVENRGTMTVVTVQAMAAERARAVALLADFRERMRALDVYKGHVLTVTATFMEGLKIEFARMPEIRREDVILPEGIMDRLEQQTVQFSEHADGLRSSGFHLKRGMLLFGPPGTGKTLTTMYLASVAEGRTVILLYGQQFASMADACAVARRLQPAMVIMEDVDLIAEDRETNASSGQLHDLLHAMDGLEGDADIQFILTTNRVDVLEKALRERPGRVDLAVEIPLPDADCRRRIFELFCSRVTVAVPDFEDWVQRTAGASATFIRELVRRAALASSQEGGSIRLEQRHFDHAIRELLEVGGDLTRRLLGFGKES